MKNLLTALFFIISINAFSQAPKWFVSVSAGFCAAGPSSSIKSQMKKQGFDDEANGYFFGFNSNIDYPVKERDISLLVSFGKKLTEKRSIYFVVGRLDKAEVRGFKMTGSTDFIGLWGGSAGPTPAIKYSIYQFTAGYMYSNTKNHISLGFGPSLFLVNYASGSAYTFGENTTTVMPGITGSARIPLGKMKKMFGTEIFFETNIAPPVKMNYTADKNEPIDFTLKSANMITAHIGIAIHLSKS